MFSITIQYKIFVIAFHIEVDTYNLQMLGGKNYEWPVIGFYYF